MPSHGHERLLPIFMSILMLSTPALTYETGRMSAEWLDSEELDEGPSEPLFTSGATATPDCDLNDVTVTEVYHYSDEWIEIHNSGSSSCDLGGWHIRDD